MNTRQQIIQKAAAIGYPNLTQAEKDIYNSTDMRLMIYETAKSCIGKKMSPLYKAYGCAEAVNAVVMLAIGNAVGGGASTYQMYQELKKNKRFKKLDRPEEGDIVISPSGYGNGKIANGHVGILGAGGFIMNNNSNTLKWDTHYDLDSWRKRYVVKGGFPMDYFRVISG